MNIIGEHIDYALFGVFPAAVEQDILIACSPSQPRSPPHASNAHDAYTHTPGVVRAQNLSTKYGPQNFAPVLRTYVSITLPHSFPLAHFISPCASTTVIELLPIARSCIGCHTQSEWR